MENTIDRGGGVMKTIKCDICGKVLDDHLTNWYAYPYNGLYRFKVVFKDMKRVDKDIMNFDICHECLKKIKELRDADEKKGESDEK